jgi:glycosyltransferase involved in cell wall biosynthesis
MKVLMLGNDSSVKGGITSVIEQLMGYHWNEVGIDMNFIPTYIESGNVKKVLFFLNSYRKIEKEFQKNRPDIVHIHMSYKGSFTRKFYIHRLCKKYGIADVIHLHGSEFKKWYDRSSSYKKKQIRTLLQECSCFIVLGDKWNTIIKEIESKTKTIIVQNTVHIPEATVQWSDDFKILFMGVLIPRKGVADLLKAVEILKNSGKMRNTKLVIAGSGSEEETLKKLCKELKIEKYVEFTGWIAGEKKAEFYKTAQMLVLPSYNEGLPIAILEGISYGMPVVATDVGDVSSAVWNGENGYLVVPGDAEALAESLYNIYSNREVYNTMSERSRQIAEEKFSDEQYFKTFEKMYLEVGEQM